MKHLFVSYNVALQLKEKGFDEECLRWYNEKGILKSNISLPSDRYDQLNAPLYQQVIDWFREKHNIYLAPFPIYRGEKIAFYKVDFAVIGETKDTTEIFGLNDSFNTHYEALTKAIEEALKLI